MVNTLLLSLLEPIIKLDQNKLRFANYELKINNIQKLYERINKKDSEGFFFFFFLYFFTLF
jgi:hypothetical protein